MKGVCEEDGCDALMLVLALEEEAVLELGSKSEARGVMAADRRRGARLLAWAMIEEERVEAAAVLAKRP